MRRLSEKTAFRVYALLAAAETVLIFYYSAYSLPGPVSDAFSFDVYGWLRHFAAYSVYGFLLFNVFSRLEAFDKKNIILLTLIAGIAVGAATELMQFSFPARLPDVVDFCMDAAGVIVGILAAKRLGTKGLGKTHK